MHRIEKGPAGSSFANLFRLAGGFVGNVERHEPTDTDALAAELTPERPASYVHELERGPNRSPLYILETAAGREFYVRARCGGCGEYAPCSDSQRRDISGRERAKHTV
mgnify:CR=1 FL=1